MCDPVGIGEIAERLGVPPNTLHARRKRGRMPPPRWTVHGYPTWDWRKDIAPWLRVQPLQRRG